jgi:hypothetical protein
MKLLLLGRYGQILPGKVFHITFLPEAASPYQEAVMKTQMLAIIALLGMTFTLGARTDPADLAGRAEDHAVSFKSSFLEALSSSTVDIKDRDRYRAWLDSLESSVARAAEASRRESSVEARRHLVDAMEVAVEIDHFMQRSSWNQQSETSWHALRRDLNTLAEHHELPTLSGSFQASR